MSVHQPVTNGGLPSALMAQVSALAGAVTSDQALWISGYFAGLGAATRSGSAARKLTIIHAGETGNGASIAKQAAAALADRSPSVVDASHYKVRNLKDEQDLLLIVATHGEGDPPQGTFDFFEFLEGPRAPRLEAVRFAVLALGDSTYEYYCEAGKRVDRRLAELGAQRLAERVDCDVDFEVAAAAWRESVVRLLAAPEAGPAAVPAAAAEPAEPAAPLHDKKNPFPATMLANIPLVAAGSAKDTRHIEFDLAGSGLTYAPGDSLGIYARNSAETVEAVLAVTDLDPAAEVEVEGQQLSLGEALDSRFEIAIATPRFLEAWAKLSGAAELKPLLAKQARAERNAFLHDNHVVDIARRFPVKGLGAGELLAALRPMQPRLYSLASSQALVGDEAHLTVAPIRYALHGEQRSGVASAHLADRAEPGSTFPAYVQPSAHFHLPEDETPIIMIGPGTGVAPFRAFLQEREARGSGGKSWLFFGERNFKTDFLYQIEWQQWLADGLLTRMDVAFSRDQAEKIYVQHRLIERAAEVYSWLMDGAIVYVCGDATSMAPDVEDALIQVLAIGAGQEREAALEQLKELRRAKRYLRDVY